MKKIVFASLLALGTSTLLAGCGLIPAQTVADPFGLKGQTLTSSTLSTSSTSIRVAGTGNASVEAIFEDIKSLLLTPAKIDISLALATATISPFCAAAANQTSIQVTLSNFKVTLSDGAGATARSLFADLPTTTFNVNPTTGVITGLSLSGLTFSVPEIGKAINILTTTPTPNKATVSTDIATVPALPGCKISVTLGDSSGTFSF
jgi:hypothetical protein